MEDLLSLIPQMFSELLVSVRQCAACQRFNSEPNRHASCHSGVYRPVRESDIHQIITQRLITSYNNALKEKYKMIWECIAGWNLI